MLRFLTIMKYLTVLLISLITAASSLHAKTSDALALDYAQGAAYCLIVQQAMEQSGFDAEATKPYGQMYTALSTVSQMLSWETRSVEMGEKVTLSRIALYKRAMGAEMGNRNENISILINKYGQSSQELFNNAAQVIEQL
jgi:hypothetical protein